MSMREFVDYTFLTEEATPGPWKADGEVRGDCVVWGPDGRFLMNAQAEPHWVPDPSGVERSVAFDADQRDTKFIAASRNMAPKLVAAIEAALAVYEEYHPEDPDLGHDMYEAIMKHIGD